MEFYISPQSGQFYMINVLENQWLSVTYRELSKIVFIGNSIDMEKYWHKLVFRDENFQRILWFLSFVFFKIYYWYSCLLLVLSSLSEFFMLTVLILEYCIDHSMKFLNREIAADPNRHWVMQDV